MSDDFTDWIARRVSATDTLDPMRSNALAAALGGEDSLVAGDPLPLLRHWLYFWDVRPPAELGGDGHPARGDFLPPVPLPRRMWAGGRAQFEGVLRLGERITRVSTITGVEAKNGRSGPLVFVTVRHELIGGEGRVVEDQDIVYREAASGSQPSSPTDTASGDAAWRTKLLPDPVLLFRYSALTMNGHRIHYDRRYATEGEGYSGLVVHGPLQATLLIDLAARQASAPIKNFAFRGLAPAFDGTRLDALGDPSPHGATLRMQQGGVTTMTAIAEWEAP